MTDDGDGGSVDRPGGGSPPLEPSLGRILHVTGRRAQGGASGMPALDRISLELGDGTVRDFGPPNAGETGKLQVLAPIQQGMFQREGKPWCTICLEGEATEREHVPQGKLGGRSMTWTCAPCNNGLGSRVEADLQAWFDYALVGVTFDYDGDITGHRYVPTLYYRKASDGSFLLAADGELSADARMMLSSGAVNITYQPPDPRRYRLALLKHAYLAACLYLRQAPGAGDAQTIRDDLLTVRDLPRKASPPESEIASRLDIYRSGVGRQGPPLALVAQADPRARDAEPQVLISLAGVVFVSWPFNDRPPGTWVIEPDIRD